MVNSFFLATGLTLVDLLFHFFFPIKSLCLSIKSPNQEGRPNVGSVLEAGCRSLPVRHENLDVQAYAYYPEV